MKLKITLIFIVGLVFSLILQLLTLPKCIHCDIQTQLAGFIFSWIVGLGIPASLAFFIKKKLSNYARAIFWGATVGVVGMQVSVAYLNF